MNPQYPGGQSYAQAPQSPFPHPALTNPVQMPYQYPETGYIQRTSRLGYQPQLLLALGQPTVPLVSHQPMMPPQSASMFQQPMYQLPLSMGLPQPLQQWQYTTTTPEPPVSTKALLPTSSDTDPGEKPVGRCYRRQFSVPVSRLERDGLVEPHQSEPVTGCLPTVPKQDLFTHTVLIAPNGTARVVVYLDSIPGQKTTFKVSNQKMRIRARRWDHLVNHETVAFEIRVTDNKAMDAVYWMLHIIHDIPTGSLPYEIPSSTLAHVVFFAQRLGAQSALRDSVIGWKKVIKGKCGGDVDGVLENPNDLLYLLYVAVELKDLRLQKTVERTIIHRYTLDSDDEFLNTLQQRQTLPRGLREAVADILDSVKTMMPRAPATVEEEPGSDIRHGNMHQFPQSQPLPNNLLWGSDWQWGPVCPGWGTWQYTNGQGVVYGYYQPY